MRYDIYIYVIGRLKVNAQVLGGIPFSVNYPSIILQVVELF